METTTRNATLADLAGLLKDQHARKIDVVAPASAIRSIEGVITVKGAEAQIDETGVTTTDGRYVPTAVFDEGIAAKLGVPPTYLKRLRAERVDLYDANVNGWLHGRKAKGAMVSTRENHMAQEWHETRPSIPGDPRKFLFRGFKGDDGVGVARAFLSDAYKVIDHLDALTAALDGARQVNADIQIESCDLTDRRMYVRITAPEVQAYAHELLKGYRSPFTGQSGDENPVVFAGLEISNSETGGGAFTITPRMVVQVCTNGMKITKDAMRAVHLGGKMDEGVIRWSEDTQRKQIELITMKTRDAVATYLDVEYMQGVIAGMQQAAGVVVDSVDVVKSMGKRLTFSEETIDGVLGHFVRGGQMTAGGVMQAITAYAQTVDDADLAADLETDAMKVLALV